MLCKNLAPVPEYCTISFLVWAPWEPIVYERLACVERLSRVKRECSYSRLVYNSHVPMMPFSTFAIAFKVGATTGIRMSLIIIAMIGQRS